MTARALTAGLVVACLAPAGCSGPATGAAVGQASAPPAPSARAYVFRREPVTLAFTVDGSEVFWLSDRRLRAATLASRRPRTLARFEDETIVPIVLQALGEEVIVLSRSGKRRALEAVPRTGGEPRLITRAEVSGLTRDGRGLLWVERDTAGSAWVARLGATRGARPTRLPAPARVTTVVADGDVLFLTQHDTVFGPGRLLRLDAAGQRSLLASDRQLVIIGADPRRVFVLERRPDRSRIHAVDKRGAPPRVLFTARFPGEMVLSPRIGIDGDHVYLTELDTSGDSDSGTIWRVSLVTGEATSLLRTATVPLQPLCAGGFLYFLQIDKGTGGADLVRVPLR